ncbi:MAG: multidrug efflux RND transporter permease subunit [Cellvibrionales bacterium]|nr:multidrug efflux RND transporter permease subunit [Cellvibrionales bacterium]
MLSEFFIGRPKFALVISIVITLAGFIALMTLPVAQYPEVAPPQVTVSAVYPGASANVVEKTIAGPIEDVVNGVEGMIYMKSTSDSNGIYNLSVTFDLGTDPDMAVVRVQNKLAQADAKIPYDVKVGGVIANKSSPDMLMIISIYSPDKSKDFLFLTNYAQINIQSVLARTPGVSDAKVFGGTYSMRLWLNPDMLTSLGLTAKDVFNAIKEQNVQVASGTIGSPPYEGDIQRQYTLQVLGRLEDVEQFENIIIRSNPDGSQIHLRDVAKVELGQSDYSILSEFNGFPAVNMAIYLTPDANALQVNAKIMEELEELKKNFPEGVDYSASYNTSKYVSESIGQVQEALYEAVVLVILISFIFLGSFRATLVPSIAIPVSLIGTFLFLAILGMSINTMSLLALILAIGIVVDDAILVIENTERHLHESPEKGAKQAAIDSMGEITAPIIATTLVLLAVFVPVSVLPGLTGQMYRQLGITISVSVIISCINALTLSPVLCALLLKPNQKEAKWYKGFTRFVEKTTEKYGSGVGYLLRKLVLVALVVIGIVVATGLGFLKIPKAFVPDEDQGVYIVSIQLPDDASLSRSKAVAKKVEALIWEDKNTESVTSITGFSLMDGTQKSNAAVIFVVLKPWDERPGMENSVFASFMRVNKLAPERIPEATIFSMPPPSIPGIGSVGGMELVIQDTMGTTYEELSKQTQLVSTEAMQSGIIASAFSTFRADVPQYFLDIDREKAKNLGVPLADVFQTLQANLGSLYINDFNKYGQTYSVVMQADARNRKDLSDLQDFYVKNIKGEMIPLTSFISPRKIFGPDAVTRYNKFRASVINAQTAPGFGTSEAIEEFAKIQKDMAEGFQQEWTGQVYQEIKSGSAAIVGFILAIIFIYLFLVAQYESWSIPLAIMLVVPVALGGSVLILFILGMPLNLYGQLGLVLLLCMASKNAILIVEFAKEKREAGDDIVSAAQAAAKLRFRAINMTAISFIAGMIPLMFASGPGAFAQITLSVPVVAGMIVALIVGTFLIPCFYVIVQTLREKAHRLLEKQSDSPA